MKSRKLDDIPKYDVIMAVKNGTDYLYESLNSIFRQSLQPNRVLLIDDYSTDQLKPFLSQEFPQVEYFLNPGVGQASALNYGIEISTSDYLAFLDADDFWEVNKQHKQVSILREMPSLSYVRSGLRNFESTDNDLSYREFKDSRSLGSSTFQKNLFLEFGCFSLDKGKAWLFDFFTRIKNVQYVSTGTIELNRRIHGMNSVIVERNEYLKDLFVFLRNKS